MDNLEVCFDVYIIMYLVHMEKQGYLERKEVLKGSRDGANFGPQLVYIFRQ